MHSRFDKIRDFHANMHPVLRAGLWLVVFAAIAAVAARPAYKEFRIWRANEHLANARKELDAGKPAKAREYSFAAITLSPSDFRAIPLLAESMRALRDPRATDVARFLVGHPNSSEADRLTGFQIMADDAPLATVGSAWQFLGPERQKQPAFRVIFVRRLIEQTHYEEATTLLKDAGPRGQNPELDVEWMRLAILSGDGQSWFEAQELGRKTLVQSPASGAAILTIWEKLPADAVQAGTAAAARAWCDSQGDHASADARLATSWLEIAALPKDQRDDKIQETINAFLPTHPGELGQWLVRHGKPELVLGLAVPPAVIDSPAWFTAKSSALRALSKWKELLAYLDKAPKAMPPLELACDRMFAAAMLGDTARRNLELKNARDLTNADSTRNAFLILAEAAAKAGMKEQADFAMVEAIRLGRGRLPLHARLMPLIQSLSESGRGRDLLDVFSQLVVLEPGNPMVLTSYCYLGVIHGMADTVFVLERMDAMRKDMPNAVPVRMVLCLTWLAKGDAAKACEATEVEGFDWSTAAPACRAARGSALLLNGKTAEAEAMLAGINWDEMLPRETNFFHNQLRKFIEGKSPIPWLANLKRRPESDASATPVESARTPTKPTP